MKLTAKEREAKTAADLTPEQFGEFKIPTNEYAQLYPAYYYTMCTDTMHEIEDRDIEPSTNNSESEAEQEQHQTIQET